MIIPAIISKTFSDLTETLDGIGVFTKTVQIDIVDGKFVPFVSWPYGNDGSSIVDLKQFTQEFKIGLDLMTEKPEDRLEEWIRTGVERIVIHVESTNVVRECITRVRGAGMKMGLALSNDTSLDAVTSYIGQVDFVQCMGIAEIGKQGNAFDSRVLERIRELKAAYPDLLISVDGSVNRDTVADLAAAGAGRLVSGSAILRADDPQEAFTELSRLEQRSK